MLAETIIRWLNRNNGESPSSSGRYDNLQVAVGSDVGLSRSENQDSVAALSFSPRSNNLRPFTAVCLVDGMGGMRDGRECATRSIAAFFDALVQHRAAMPPKRLELAAQAANEAVFNFARGRGGATLASVLYEHERAWIVHVGDSRIYGYKSEFADVVRLTVDDSLDEFVGEGGKDLIQFIGVGAGLKPHVNQLSPDIGRVILTSDGVHYLPAATIQSLISNASNRIDLINRLLAVARWCGSPDNASVAVFDVGQADTFTSQNPVSRVDVCDPRGSLQIVWSRDDVDAAVHPLGKNPPLMPERMQNTTPRPPNIQKDKRKRTKRKRVDLAKEDGDDIPLLEIKINEPRE